MENVHPAFSVDCVIITFHEKKLKVLLNKFDFIDKWMLPGGWVQKDEDIDIAALRILKERTGLENVYLMQFHCFGKANRTNLEENKMILEALGELPDEMLKLFVTRFISVGYFALVKYDNIIIEDRKSDIYQWVDLDNIPKLYTDHNYIIDKAINIIKLLIDYLPIGYRLLPEKFILPDLRAIYEGILGEPIDKRNFQKKMLSSGLIRRLDERKEVSTYPNPYFYVFNKEKFSNCFNFSEIFHYRLSNPISTTFLCSFTRIFHLFFLV